MPGIREPVNYSEEPDRHPSPKINAKLTFGRVVGIHLILAPVPQPALGQDCLGSLFEGPISFLSYHYASSASSRTYTSPIALFKQKTKASAKKCVWVLR
uniref:Sulfite oxidase n=1 Tax=Tanacetum cinerariifolium TaxID=118510 RepID=A0A699H3X8_TANCI|nr:sulfite oxidase [Tanacetum cinerariifolium]